MSAIKTTSDIRVQVSKDLHKRIKIRALQEDTTLQKVVVVALEAYLAQPTYRAQVAQKTQIAKPTQKTQTTRKSVIRTEDTQVILKPEVHK